MNVYTFKTDTAVYIVAAGGANEAREIIKAQMGVDLKDINTVKATYQKVVVVEFGEKAQAAEGGE